MALLDCPPRVISMQSFVVDGRVGNSAAMFTLQRLGAEVCPLHTVMYSGHLGNPGWTGSPLDPALLSSLLDGLDAHGTWARCDLLLTGYLGSAAHGEVALDAARRLRSQRAHAPWVCDPVLGDHGRLYVTRDLIAVYRDQIAPYVDILTPNLSELSWLSGESLKHLHDEGAIVSSARAVARALREGGVVCVKCSQKESARDASRIFVVDRERAWRIDAPRWPRDFVGAGDLFSACIAADIARGEHVLDAIMAASSRTASVLEKTWKLGDDALSLVAAQRELERAHRADVTLTPLPPQ